MFQSINPYTGKLIREYELTSEKMLSEILNLSDQAFLKWKKIEIQIRVKQIKKLAKLLLLNKEKAALLITQEMGKPISQSYKEIEKCAELCLFYAKNATTFLKAKKGNTDYESHIIYEPLGTILGIMPWNFPFWQVFRFVIPTLLSGNIVLVKHAPNVPQCAKLIEQLFSEVLSISNCYQNIFLTNFATEKLIENPLIKGVSFTGSTKAGRKVAAISGKSIKPTILELGGSNAMVVFEDADLTKAVENCVQGRFLNNGQSCIAIKRLIIHENIESIFTKKLIDKIMELQIGIPTNKDSYISSLAKAEFAEELAKKIHKSVKMGAKLIYGGSHKGAFFEPTIVTEVSENMPLFKEETFGPVLAITSFKATKKAIHLANNTNFGLGVSLFSENKEFLKTIIPAFEDGAVFINSLIKSDSALPFGGTKTSGIGRELAEEGIKAFVNTKTVVIF